jgi:HEAT repeat protein
MRAALVLAVSVACAPRACDDTDDHMARDVQMLVGPSAAAADAAEERLVARGRAAIVMLEAGLYQTDPPGRRRIVGAIGRIGHPDAAPLLRHLAARDPDETVRAAAAQALSTLPSHRSP